MIRLQSLAYTYPNSTVVFEDFDCSVEKGEAWCVLGPSGCGKTTLLYLLAGLRFPTAGKELIIGGPQGRPRPNTGLSVRAS